MARRDLAIWSLILFAAALLPLFTESRYLITTVTLFFIWATVATQWNLVLGVAGIFSLAQFALFAVGAYGTAILSLYADWPVWVSIPTAALIAVAASVLIGLACLRLSGPYVALLTLAIAQAMYFLIVTDTACFIEGTYRCQQFTGGARGLARFGDLGFRDWLGSQWYLGNYYVGLGLFVAGGLLAFAVIASPVGLAFQALRDNPAYAAARGISRFAYQLLVFAVSAFFTALAGGFYAAHFKVVAPNILSFPLLLFVLAMIVVGGIGRRWGPVVGAVLLVVADESLKEFGDYRDLGLGLIIMLCIMLLPDGVVGGLSRRLRGGRRKPRPRAIPASGEETA